MIDNYHLTRKNATFDFHILHGHPWGGRFQMAVIGDRQVTGEKGRNPSGRKVLISYIWKVFGDVISFGSGQLALHVIISYHL